MLCIKLLSLFVAIVCLMPESQVKATFWIQRRCNFRCRRFENTIFTTDGTNCFVLRNRCFLRRINCNRRIKGLPRLPISTKEDCQDKCKTTCPTEKSPVCGEYRGIYTTFDNACLLLKAACENGRAILKVRNSACPVQV